MNPRKPKPVRYALADLLAALPELRSHGVERVRIDADGSVEVDLDTQIRATHLTPQTLARTVTQSPPSQLHDGDPDNDPNADQDPQKQAVGDSLDVAHLG